MTRHCCHAFKCQRHESRSRDWKVLHSPVLVYYGSTHESSVEEEQNRERKEGGEKGWAEKTSL